MCDTSYMIKAAHNVAVFIRTSIIFVYPLYFTLNKYFVIAILL